MWVSINATWFNGGKTLVDDTPQGDLFDKLGCRSYLVSSDRKGAVSEIQFHVGAFTSTVMIVTLFHWFTNPYFEVM